MTKAKNNHGGARKGAGRPKKNRANQEIFEDAESYLEAVVQGKTQPDVVRVQAAKCLIAYQKTKARGIKKSPSAGQLEKQESRDIENSRLLDFEKRAAKVRKKYREVENE